MGTTPCESLTASANIFIGQSEAPLMVKPFLGKMTPSELHAVMTGGFASIAGNQKESANRGKMTEKPFHLQGKG